MFNLKFFNGEAKSSISISDVQGNLDNLEKDINRNLLPTLYAMLDHDFQCSFYKENETFANNELKRMKFKKDKRDWQPQELLETYIFAAQQMARVIPWIRNQFKGRVINVEGMELNQANLLQLVELCEFVFDFISNATIIITHYEMKGIDSNASGLIPTYEEKHELNNYSFLLALSILGRDLNDIKSSYGRIPALIADPEKYYELQQSIGKANADPLNLSAPPFPLSLIFYVQLSWADWQMNRLEKAETTAKAVQYRLLLIKRAQNNEAPDAAIEKQAEIYEARLKQVQRKIAKMEKAYGLEGV